MHRTLTAIFADQIVCVTKANDSRQIFLVRAADGVEIARQDTFLSEYAMRGATDVAGTTRILAAAFSSSDSSKIAFVTSEGAQTSRTVQSKFGGHLVILNMVRK